MKKVFSLILSAVAITSLVLNTPNIGETANATDAVNSGTYPTRAEVILIRNSDSSVATMVGHAAIVYNQSYVVEALSGGVVRGSNNWNIKNQKVAAVTVRQTSIRQDRQALEYAYGKIGCPYLLPVIGEYVRWGSLYKWSYKGTLDRRDKFYCSHLVYAAYLDLFSINLNCGDSLKNTITPLALNADDNPKTTYVYRKNWDY